MLFNSLQYGAFLAAVFAVTWSLAPSRRRLFLLAASYLFYGLLDWRAVVLVVVATAASYFSARAIPGTRDAQRRLLAGIGVGTSVAGLVGFKVLGFLTLGAQAGVGRASVLVPIGLSFFTFHTISYVVDVYRGDIPASDSFVDVALYVAFFPHLLAGPVVRAGKMFPIFNSLPVTPSRAQLAEGGELILVGLFKKVALADPGWALVLPILQQRGLQGTVSLAMASAGALVFGYFDITGYIDMARGSAKLLGVELPPHSIQPLLRSHNFADFWRRWQLTLSMWFRDYVYRPIRGDRSTPGREYLALLGSFVALGLWHGVGLNWLAWGAVVAGTLSAERMVQARRAKRHRAEQLRTRRRAERDRTEGRPAATATEAPPRPSPVVSRARSLLYVYAVFAITAPIAFAAGLSGAVDLYANLASGRVGFVPADLVVQLVAGAVAVVLLDGRERRRLDRSGGPDPISARRAVAFGVMVLAVVVFSGPQAQPFIYLTF